MTDKSGQLEPGTGQESLLPPSAAPPMSPKSSKLPKLAPFSDIDLSRWKDYSDVWTDSLWVIDRRDTSGAHINSYHGNFIPQIPHQLMMRYTKKGDWVLDPFLGSGTTLIECIRMGRNGIGVELNESVADKSKSIIASEPNSFGVTTVTSVGDSSTLPFRDLLDSINVKSVQLAVLHPPYHGIIKFSDNPADLSNAGTVDDFLLQLSRVVSNTMQVLDEGRYMALVIGDKYEKGKWIPLGFYAMQKVMDAGMELKSIVVKNYGETRGKSHQQSLWRYRALQGGYYLFKHEYVFIFRKA